MPNKFLISGAGIAGLSLARRFRQLSIPFDLIEKQSTITTTGAGIALPANAMTALRHLGLADTVKQHAHQVKKVIYAEPSGKVLNSASLLEPPLNKDPFVALHRKKLHDILLADGIEDYIQFNTTVTELEQTDDGITVKFNNDNSSETKYSGIVGADGLHSTVRTLAFGKIDLVDLAVTNWRWTTHCPTENLEPTYMLGTTDAFLAYPIGENEVYCYAHKLDPKNKLTTGDHQRTIQDTLIEYDGIAADLLQQLPNNSEIIPGRLRSVPYPFFSKKSVALIGDASSACSPMLQQGAACAFEDVAILSELLCHFSPREAFEHYENYRKERVSWIVDSSDTPMKLLIKATDDMLVARNENIRTNGPLNVQGWRKLLANDPIAELPDYIKSLSGTDENRPCPTP